MSFIAVQSYSGSEALVNTASIIAAKRDDSYTVLVLVEGKEIRAWDADRQIWQKLLKM